MKVIVKNVIDHWSRGLYVVICRQLISFWLEWKMLNLTSVKWLLYLALHRYHV